MQVQADVIRAHQVKHPDADPSRRMLPDHLRRRAAITAAIPEFVDQPVHAGIAGEGRHVAEPIEGTFVGQRERNADGGNQRDRRIRQFLPARAKSACAADHGESDGHQRDEGRQQRRPRSGHPQTGPAQERTSDSEPAQAFVLNEREKPRAPERSDHPGRIRVEQRASRAAHRRPHAAASEPEVEGTLVEGQQRTDHRADRQRARDPSSQLVFAIDRRATAQPVEPQQAGQVQDDNISDPRHHHRRAAADAGVRHVVALDERERLEVHLAECDERPAHGDSERPQDEREAPSARKVPLQRAGIRRQTGERGAPDEEERRQKWSARRRNEKHRKPVREQQNREGGVPRTEPAADGAGDRRQRCHEGHRRIEEACVPALERERTGQRRENEELRQLCQGSIRVCHVEPLTVASRSSSRADADRSMRDRVRPARSRRERRRRAAPAAIRDPAAPRAEPKRDVSRQVRS